MFVIRVGSWLLTIGKTEGAGRTVWDGFDGRVVLSRWEPEREVESEVETGDRSGVEDKKKPLTS